MKKMRQNMMKRKRKPRTKNNYFTKVHEDAIVKYAISPSRQEKSQLYMSLIQPAFDEMVNKIKQAEEAISYLVILPSMEGK